MTRLSIQAGQAGQAAHAEFPAFVGTHMDMDREA